MQVKGKMGGGGQGLNQPLSFLNELKIASKYSGCESLPIEEISFTLLYSSSFQVMFLSFCFALESHVGGLQCHLRNYMIKY